MIIQWLLVLPALVVADITTTLTKMHDWDDNFEAHFIFHLDEEVDGWEAILTFDQPIPRITVNSWLTYYDLPLYNTLYYFENVTVL